MVAGVLLGRASRASQIRCQPRDRCQRASSAQVSALNAELEQRVEQRTAALQSEIAERLRAEESVKESLATSTAALKELADQKFALDQHAIVAVTTSGHDYLRQRQVLRYQPVFEGRTDWPKSPHPQLSPPSEEFFQQMYYTIANGKVWHGEIKNRANDGSIYWVDTTIVPTLSVEGKPRQYVRHPRRHH